MLILRCVRTLFPCTELWKMCTLHQTGSRFVCVWRENGVPVLSLSNQKEIALEVSVSNAGGDDAYEASMIASFPSSLTYSATRLLNKVSVSDTLSLSLSHTQTPTLVLIWTYYWFQVNCQANRNGSLVDCELGNPFEKGEMVSEKSQFGTI